MSWSDRHEADDESDDDQEQVLGDEFDEWAREGNQPVSEGRTESSGDDVARGRELRPREGADEPLQMTQCPRCDCREFVSKKLVYEEFHYSEGGDLEHHQNRVRAEFEYTCIGCTKRFHELPTGARSYYSEVAVLKQDLRRAIRVQVRTWLDSLGTLVRKPFRD
ncbi:hypothetical protein [Saliphagus infecundisoli]|uniref:Uncharacterized protein n=1 Tax=Saliphagus infecundisoli TaxID=1849069 RepID=A0ABD5QHM1_9EURY|nr:hypothetical protein [Saliphagus infecundisoli]